MAKCLKFGSTAITNVESGRNEPSFDTLLQLAQILAVTPNELLGILPDSETERFRIDFQKLPPDERE